jgi:hypothetical protein
VTPGMRPVVNASIISHANSKGTDDWWWWEIDEPLAIKGDWIRVCRFPDSLQEVCLELESLESKKNQIDWIADEIVKSWHLRKLSGIFMSASKTATTVSRWSGSSIWQGARWIRDEARPGVNDYYAKTIAWKPDGDRKMRPKPRDLVVPGSLRRQTGGFTTVRVARLLQAGLPLDVPADVIWLRFSHPEGVLNSEVDWDMINGPNGLGEDDFGPVWDAPEALAIEEDNDTAELEIGPEVDPEEEAGGAEIDTNPHDHNSDEHPDLGETEQATADNHDPGQDVGSGLQTPVFHQWQAENPASDDDDDMDDDDDDDGEEDEDEDEDEDDEDDDYFEEDEVFEREPDDS